MGETGEELSSSICKLILAINNKQVIINDTVKQYCISELTPPIVVITQSTIHSIVYQISEKSSQIVSLEIGHSLECPLKFIIRIQLRL